MHVDKCIFVCNHISNFDPIWFNSIFHSFTLVCAGEYDYFWEAIKQIGLLSMDDKSGKGCIYTNYFGSKAEREAVLHNIEEDMARGDGRPFLIYPEGCVTTGVSAVMQYQKVRRRKSRSDELWERIWDTTTVSAGAFIMSV